MKRKKQHVEFTKAPTQHRGGYDHFVSECGRYKLVLSEGWDGSGRRCRERWYADRYLGHRKWTQLEGSPFKSKDDATRACKTDCGEWTDEDEPEYQEGRKAACSGMFCLGNPYDDDARAFDLWRRGWLSIKNDGPFLWAPSFKRRKEKPASRRTK